MDSKQFFTHFIEQFNPEMTIEEIYAIEEELTQPCAEIWDVVEQLYGTYRLAILSNMSTFGREARIHQFPYEKYFEEIFWSSEHNTVKPDEAYFLLLLEKLGVKAEECLFIDDKKRNTDAADKLGFHTITFTTSKETIQKIRETLNA